jgi:hypothetical protein
MFGDPPHRQPTFVHGLYAGIIIGLLIALIALVWWGMAHDA